MARSVADKFSKREDVLFPLNYFYGNFRKIPPFTDDTTGNKVSRKEGEKTGILFIEVKGMRYFGGGGQHKNYILISWVDGVVIRLHATQVKLEQRLIECTELIKNSVKLFMGEKIMSHI